MPENRFSDEELVAYLDGESEHAPVEEINTALRTDVALAKRLENLRIDTGKIAAAFEETLDTDRTAPIFTVVSRNAGWKRQLAAASIFAAIVGFGAGQYLMQPASPGWKDYVAAYQALYTTSTLSGISRPADVLQNELDKVGASIGKTIPVEALSDFPEVEFKRAQILGFKSKALVQLAFLSSTGEPIALCILRVGDKSETSMETATLEGMSAVSWKSGGYGYLLIGGQDNGLLERMAESFVARQI